MDTSEPLRQHIVILLKGRGAHADFEAAVAGLPAHLRGVKPAGAPHTAWQLVEHLRIAQWDILEFTRDPKHVSPAWPEGYWPATEAAPSDSAWDATLAKFRGDLEGLQSLVSDPGTDLLAPLAHGQGQTVLREALLAADHNAYHIGQLVMLRNLLGAWK
ncbi:MAG: transporter [Bryobacterales bacterium]|nr:transporter [Bryobacterales bacterium]